MHDTSSRRHREWASRPTRGSSRRALSILDARSLSPVLGGPTWWRTSVDRLFPNVADTTHSAMVFVDGENFAIRYESLLHQRPIPEHVKLQPGVFVWANGFNNACVMAGVRRKHYYTSVQGDACPSGKHA